jgi:hypothetical protein
MLLAKASQVRFILGKKYSNFLKSNLFSLSLLNVYVKERFADFTNEKNYYLS